MVPTRSTRIVSEDLVLKMLYFLLSTQPDPCHVIPRTTKVVLLFRLLKKYTCEGICLLPDLLEMNVYHPSNVEDCAINSQGNYAEPSDVPTGMGFMLTRIQFADILREVVDAAWSVGCDVDSFPYDTILEIDKKINDFFTRINRDFAIYQNRNNSYMPNAESQLFYKQRNWLHFGVHTRLARVHRPYLVRGARDSRYAYSRMVCLRSARTVIELGKAMMSNKNVVAMKIWCVNHHIFVAVVILVMDYCFNRDEPRAKERKDEIMECFRMLESSRDESTMATRGLQRLRHILQTASASGKSLQGGSNLCPRALDLAKEPQMSQQFEALDANPYQGTQPVALIQNTLPSSWDGKSLEVPSHQNWPELDFPSFENVNFDVDLDASEFETLFQNFDPNEFF